MNKIKIFGEECRVYGWTRTRQSRFPLILPFTDCIIDRVILATHTCIFTSKDEAAIGEPITVRCVKRAAFEAEQEARRLLLKKDGDTSADHASAATLLSGVWGAKGNDVVTFSTGQHSLCTYECMLHTDEDARVVQEQRLAHEAASPDADARLIEFKPMSAEVLSRILTHHMSDSYNFDVVSEHVSNPEEVRCRGVMGSPIVGQRNGSAKR